MTPRNTDANLSMLMGLALALAIYIAGYSQAMRANEMYAIQRNAPWRIRYADYGTKGAVWEFVYWPAHAMDCQLRPAYWNSPAALPREMAAAFSVCGNADELGR